VTAAVCGVGTSAFAKQSQRSLASLAWTAIEEAFADAGVTSVDAVYVGSVFAAPGAAQRALHGFGITEVPILTIENACASGTSAFHEARIAVASGRFERVLALGIEQMSTLFDGAIHPEATDPEGRSGMALPGLYAMSAARYRHEFGVQPWQLAAVAVKNRRHAVGNSRAQFRRETTIEEVLASRMIADPLTLLQCCPIADAAAAAVIAPARRARDVPIRASVLRSGKLWDHRSPFVWGFEVARDTARAAFEKAGIEPGDVDVLEVHDAFTIGEIVTVEALGLVEIGRGAAAIESGRFGLGGSQPVNTSGGLLSRGHPLGATGLAQVAEIVWQLRGEAGERQVEDARVGVVETMGGGVAGIDANACVVAVLGG
jgi:acetyl-CoA C-acetyltransferase